MTKAVESQQRRRQMCEKLQSQLSEEFKTNVYEPTGGEEGSERPIKLSMLK